MPFKIYWDSINPGTVSRDLVNYVDSLLGKREVGVVYGSTFSNPPGARVVIKQQPVEINI